MTTSAVSPPKPRLSVQAFWLTLSKFIAALFNIAIPVVLVRLLSQVDYGVYKQFFLFTATVTSLASFGVGVSAYYYMPRNPERGSQIALNILIYNAISGSIPLLLLLFFPRLVNLIFRSGDLQPYAFLLGLVVFLALDASLVELMPTALQDVRSSTIFVVGTQLAKGILIVTAAFIFGSVRSLVFAMIASTLLSITILVRYLYRRFGPFWRHFDPHFFREQLWYALPLGAYGMMWVIRKDLDNYFVSAMYKPAEYAIYAIGWLEVPFISLFLESILAVMVVRISALQHEGRVEDIRRVLASAINRVAAVQFPVYALLLVAGRDLIVFFYTKTYEASARIFSITITLIILNVFLYDPVVRAYKELRKFILFVRIAVLLTMFAALAPIIRHFGMTGAAATAVAADLLERFFVGWKVCRTIGATVHDLPLLSDLLPVIGVTAAAGLVAYTVHGAMSSQALFLRIAATGVSLGAVYVAGFYIFRLPGWETLSKASLQQFARSRIARLRGANS